MIGFYDTGLGGKRIAEAFHGLNPNQAYQYYADIQALPLGDKSPLEIRTYVLAGVEYLFEQGCNLVILACNTASVNSIRYIQAEWLPQAYPGKQVLGVTVPLQEYLQSFAQLRQEKGLLLATQATIDSQFYQEYLGRQAGYNLDYLACPGLAEAIEAYASQSDKVEVIEQLQNQLQSLVRLIASRPDYIILACTHYGYISTQIQHMFQTTQLIDPADYIAQRLQTYLERHPEYRRLGLNK